VSDLDLTFRPLRAEDLPMLSGWLAQPHVHTWWPDDNDLAAIRAHYEPSLVGIDPTELFVMELDARPIGFIQRYLIADNPEWARAFPPEVDPVDAAVGIDYLIGDAALVGRGVGSAAIRAFTDQALDRYRQADAVVVACQQANPASWRALEKAGFTREWAGPLYSDDPADAGPSYVYRRRRRDD
jgi:aminoglycoside 6'-N-acetyltransferase